MMPTSGAVICQSGTRIGNTKAIDSALKASKKVALPITTRARTNQRDVGTCSMRVIRAAAASSDAMGDETAGASDRDSVSMTDNGSLPLVFWPPLSHEKHTRPARRQAGDSDIARPLHQRQNLFRDRRRTLDRRQMA